MKVKTVLRTCLNCSQEFYTWPSEVKRGSAKYCSKKCTGEHSKKKLYDEMNKPNVVCAYCNKLFHKNATQMKQSKSGLFFCCRKHKDLSQRLSGISSMHPAHYGTKTGNSPGTDYRNVAFRNFPHKCKVCSYDKYLSVLVVHHVDEDRGNNRPENLEILCPTCHAEKHFLNNSGWFGKNVVAEGIEPSTDALSRRSSAAELSHKT